MGVRLLRSRSFSLSRTGLCFSTNSMSSLGVVLCRVSFSPAASFAKVFSRSLRISTLRSVIDFGRPASLATCTP